MASPNGTAAVVEQDDPLDLSDLVPETKVVTLPGGGKAEAFVYATAPVSVYALIAQAHDQYMAVIDDETAKGVHRDQALCHYYGQIARHLTPGMTAEQADNLGGNFKRMERYLKALGYPPPRAEVEAGEGQAAGSTTDVSSARSEPSTAAVTGTS